MKWPLRQPLLDAFEPIWRLVQLASAVSSLRFSGCHYLSPDEILSTQEPTVTDLTLVGMIARSPHRVKERRERIGSMRVHIGLFAFAWK
jgi:hypothetical protein